MIVHKFASIHDIKSMILKGAMFTLTYRHKIGYFPISDKLFKTRKTGMESSGIKFTTFKTDLIKREKTLIVKAKTKGNKFEILGAIHGLVYIYKPNDAFSYTSFENNILTLFWNGLITNKMPRNIEYWYPKKCDRCKRWLTDPLSIELGLGPGCLKKTKEGRR